MRLPALPGVFEVSSNFNAGHCGLQPLLHGRDITFSVLLLGAHLAAGSCMVENFGLNLLLSIAHGIQ